jgi:selenophosphate synthase
MPFFHGDSDYIIAGNYVMCAIDTTSKPFHAVAILGETVDELMGASAADLTDMAR